MNSRTKYLIRPSRRQAKIENQQVRTQPHVFDDDKVMTITEFIDNK